jgi:hypothetical protein
MTPALNLDSTYPQGILTSIKNQSHTKNNLNVSHLYLVYISMIKSEILHFYNKTYAGERLDPPSSNPVLNQTLGILGY